MKLNNVKYLLALAGIGVFATSYAQNIPKKLIDPANMDLSVKPGDDFYEYASGAWIKKNPVPAKETRWGSFNELREFNSSAVRSLLEKAAANKSAPAGSVSRRVGDFYTAAMDSMTIEKLGYNPIKADLAKIETIKDVNGLLALVAEMRVTGAAGGMFGVSVGQDRKNVTKYMVNLSQGGTTLSDRDDYTKNDARTKMIRDAYHTYMTTLFTLTGSNPTTAEKEAKTVFNIEKQLADAQMSRIEMRDQYKTYNKYTVADFSKNTSNINWKTM